MKQWGLIRFIYIVIQCISKKLSLIPVFVFLALTPAVVFAQTVDTFVPVQGATVGGIATLPGYALVCGHQDTVVSRTVYFHGFTSEMVVVCSTGQFDAAVLVPQNFPHPDPCPDLFIPGWFEGGFMWFFDIDGSGRFTGVEILLSGQNLQAQGFLAAANDCSAIAAKVGEYFHVAASSTNPHGSRLHYPTGVQGYSPVSPTLRGTTLGTAYVQRVKNAESANQPSASLWGLEIA